jgi:regulatory protein
MLAMTESEWSDSAIRTRDRRFGLADIRNDWDEKGRQGRFLARRGYVSDQIERALEACVREDQSVGGR